MKSDPPDGWTEGVLSDLVRLRRGHDLPEHLRRPGNVPVMGSAGQSGRHDEAAARGPGVVVGRSGASFGKVHFCTDDYWPLNTALFATDFLGNEPRFVYYALKTIAFSSFNSGSAQPSLNRNFIAGIPVAIPPRDEQQRILGVLGALDDKIESNRRLAMLLEETAATLFRARFVDFVGVTEFVASQVGAVPAAWSVGRFEALAELGKGQVRPMDQPEALFEHFSIPAFDTANGPDIVTGAEIRSGKTPVPQAGSILLSKLNPATKRVWWARPSGSGIPVCSTEFLSLSPRDGVPPSLVYALLTSDERWYQQVLANVTGTTGSRQRVRSGDVMSISTALPSGPAMAEWDSAASPMYDLAHALRVESRTLADIRNSLLPKLISGAIRVPDTSDPDEVIGLASEGFGA